MNILDTGELDRNSLVSALGAEGIGATEDRGGTLYLEEGLDFPVWLRFAEEQDLIEMFTYRSFRKEAPADGIPGFVDRLNGRYILVQFSSYGHEKETRLIGSTIVFTGSGIIVGQFADTLRRFAQIFRIAFNEGDPEELFFDRNPD